MTRDEIRLTSFASGPVHQPPSALSAALRASVDNASPVEGARLLTRPDDAAAVYETSDKTAIVHAFDLIHPVVEDPLTFGAIAAAHAISSVFAVGGEVTRAQHVAVFPSELHADVIAEVLRGSAEKVLEAGGTIASGPELREDESWYGLSVTGTVAPAQMLTQAGARVGDVIVLAKGLGTGIVLTAAERGATSEAHVEAAVQSMLQLNRAAMRLARDAGAHAMTTVKAKGVVGHALDMAQLASAQLALRAGDMPLLPGALMYAGLAIEYTDVTRNLDEYGPRAEIEEELPGAILRLVFDPQTSGGLMIAVPAAGAGVLLQRLREAGYQAAVVGSVLPGSGVAVDP